jgi:hypothetical protein
MAGTIKNRELNLLLALERSRPKKKASKTAIAFILFAALICAGIVLFFMYSISQTDAINARIDTALSYVSDPAIKAQHDESLANQAEAALLTQESGSLLNAANAINSYPDMTEADFKKLFAIADKKVQLSGISYERQTGVLSFSAKCASATQVPVFISGLRDSGMFSNVSYEGYAGGTYTVTGKSKKNSDGEGVATQKTATEYTFNVSGVVKTGAEKSNEQ